ncbi:hypothetical protein ID866_7628 [Astraeus odoratus]|nr:hypothetical protein ID866_7628 [Astraeus odoratus]
MDANAPHEFRDVFALAESHSAVLDDILSACLLRSSQRAAGDVLRSAMELVLEFCVLVGDINDGQVEERKAASSLETLYTTFRKRIAALVKVLELLLEKDTKASQMSDLWAMETEERRVPPGGAEALRLLLARLDLGNWWKMVV